MSMPGRKVREHRRKRVCFSWDQKKFWLDDGCDRKLPFTDVAITLSKENFRMTKNKSGRGRPKLPKGETRELFSLRITRQEREKIESAAKASGEKASRWARNYLLSFSAGQ